MANTSQTDAELHFRDVAAGALWMVVGSACSATVGMLVQLASRHVPDTTIIFMCYATGCAAVTPFLLLTRGAGYLKTARPKLQVLRAFAGFLYFGLLFIALRTIPLVDGVLLRSTAPAWVPILLWIFWRQKVPGRLWWGILLGFIGVALVLHPGFGVWAIGYPIALASGIAYALNNIAARHINQAGEPVARTLFYSFLVPTVVMAIPAVIAWQPVPTVAWPLLVGIGLGTVAIITFFVSGLRRAPAWIVAPFGYSGVIFAALLDWSVFDRVPGLMTVAGILVVSAGCILVILLGRPRAAGT